MMKRLLSTLLCLFCAISLFACSVPEEHRFINPTESVDWEPTQPNPTQATEPTPVTTVPPSVMTASDLADDLSLQQQVAQLFLVKCPAGGASELLKQHHVGGIVLFSQDVAGETPSSLKTKLTGYQSYVPIPLIIAVDEEGGTVTRVSNREVFRSEAFQSPRNIYLEGGLKALRETETEKAQLLKSIGINVNLAPVCDVVTEDNAFMADRSLRLTEKATGEAVAAMVKAMQAEGIGAVLKHFPGFGNLTGDTHTGKVVDDRPIEILRQYDFVPFQMGIDAKVGAVMMSHSIVNCIDETRPASLSKDVIRILREDFGFDGIIMTDDLAMGAITDSYDEGEAAVQAILAGNDMLLTGWSETQYQAILAAVETNRISPARIYESVVRIIQWKMDLGLL